MPDHPLHWGTMALARQLDPLLPGIGVEVVAHTISTNSALLERARIGHGVVEDDGRLHARGVGEGQVGGRRANDVQPHLLVAEQQSGGRGRQGKAWHSVPGASLTFSLSLPLAAADWSGLSLAVGVALADALDPPAAPGAAPRIGLKWPNDLWLLDRDAGAAAAPGRKLGGILIETVNAGARRIAVIGVGINVLPFALGQTSSGNACLQELDPAASAPLALERIARPLVLAIQRFEREGFAGFVDGFAARDLLRGRRVRTTAAAAPDGVASGVGPDGALRVRTGTATVEVASGDVSVRLPEPEPQPPPGHGAC